MTEEFDYSDPPLTTEERQRVAELTIDQAQMIDNALRGHVAQNWRKMARVVASAMLDLEAKIENVPGSYYAERLRQLVRDGVIESQGRLEVMRFCEVRRVAKP